MDWHLLAQLATVASAVFAAGTLAAGFHLYRISSRDQYIARLRLAISDSRTKCHKLGTLFGYELVDEMVNCVVYSPDMTFALRDVYQKYYAVPDADKGQLEQFLKTKFPPVTASIHSPLVEVFEETLDTLEGHAATYQIDYPGLFRVLHSMHIVLRNVFRIMKENIRHDELWEHILLTEFADRNDYATEEHLRQTIGALLKTLVRMKHKDHDQEDVRDLLRVLDLVTSAYLARGEAELIRLSKIERTADLRPIAETVNVFEDLREAEKCLRFVFAQDQLLEYREIVARYQERSRLRADKQKQS